MPNVRDFLKGHVPSEYLNEERLEFQIANFPAENMSAFLKTKKVRIATPKTPIQRVNPNEVRKYDRLGTYLKSYPSVKVAAQQEGLSVGGINKVIYGERKTAGGFQWQRCTVGSPIEQISAIETEE